MAKNIFIKTKAEAVDFLNRINKNQTYNLQVVLFNEKFESNFEPLEVLTKNYDMLENRLKEVNLYLRTEKKSLKWFWTFIGMLTN